MKAMCKRLGVRILPALVVTVAFIGRAEPVASGLAARAVNSLIVQEGQMESPVDGQVSSVRLCTATNGAAFYVAKLSGGGFVVTSTDTEIDPIIAISSEADLVEDSQNPLWALLVSDMATRQSAVAKQRKSRTRLLSAVDSGDEDNSSAAARWARLTAPDTSQQGEVSKGAGKSKISDVRVAPLLKTKWNQSWAGGKPCFNYYTPNGYPCGCTATAGAQILRYHKFPKEAVAPRTYECKVNGRYRELFQIGGVYDWNNMPNVPGSGTSDKQRRAIGKLTYDVGVAVHSMYTKYSTGGFLGDFADLCHDWGYAHATWYRDYDYDNGEKNLTKAQLKSVLIPNLDAKLPVGAAIFGPRDGHAIVADGYGYLNGQFSVHLNFGWSGGSDAWYVLPGKIAEEGYVYTGVLYLIGNIYPDGPSKGGIVSGRVLNASTSKPVSGLVVTARNGDGTVLRATTNAKGIYSFVLPITEDADWGDDLGDDDYWNDWYGYDEGGKRYVNFGEVVWEEEASMDWEISLENASPTSGSTSSTSYPLSISDCRNYYDRNFSVRIYTVKFNPNGGSGGVVSRNCNVLGTLPTTKRTGYTFEGWFTAPDGGDPVTEETLPTGNATYYAHWRANTYWVEFNANGGSGSMGWMMFTYDEAQTLSSNAFWRYGDAFRGWSLKPRRLVEFADGESVKNVTAEPDGIVTLYAFWAGDVVAADVGVYFKATLAELGYDVPTDGKTAYKVKAYGLPAGLKLKSNAAEKDKKGKITKKANVEWWIEGVPTAALDYFTNPPYLVITKYGETTTEPLLLEAPAQDVTDLGALALGASVNAKGWLAGVGAGWSVSGLPAGLKFATKKVTKKSGSKTVTVAEAYAVYGKTTKAGLFTITAKKKKGAYFETKKFRVLVTPAAVDPARFGYLEDKETMAYEQFEWNMMDDVSAVGGKVAKVTGLPKGLSFAAASQTIVGKPTTPGTYVVTFTKNVTTGTGKNKKTVAKTAQILWTVVANDAELSLGLNDNRGGVIESGVVGLKYGDLLAFSATAGAKVTASGLPKGITLDNRGDGNYAFTGFTTKADTYLVTVTATLKGKTVTQRVALEVKGLPTWAKGAYDGYVECKMENEEWATNGLATITVSSAGKISGKFQELGTNWTLRAASYADFDGWAYSAPVTATYSWKVKSGKKTVTKSITRTFALTVWQDELGGAAKLAEADGGSTVQAWQNLWSTTYKAIGKMLFYTSKKKPYRTFAVEVYTNDVGEATFIPKGDEADKTGLTYFITLSLKVTPAGAVTATLTYDTGIKKKDPKTKKMAPFYYKTTCSTVVIPTSAVDAEQFTGKALIYFAPSPANNFPGLVGAVPL